MSIKKILAGGAVALLALGGLAATRDRIERHIKKETT